MRVPLGCREQLTNARRENARGHGAVLLQSLIDEYSAPELTDSHPLLLITLNGWQEFPDGEVIAGGRVRHFAGWKPEWLASAVRRKAYDEIGKCVSAWWRVDPDVVDYGCVEHVVAVHRGVTRALFRIEPGSWETEVFGLDKNGREIKRAAFWFRTKRAAGQPPRNPVGEADVLPRRTAAGGHAAVGCRGRAGRR